MGTPSPKYTAEFKQKVVELHRKSGATHAEVARGSGRDAGGPSDRVKRAGAAQGAGAAGADPFQMAAELRGPKREDERLERGNEMLLKASALLAGRQP